MSKTVCIIFSLILINVCQAQKSIKINTGNSSIKWMGEYTFYFGGHEGFIRFSEGELILTDDMITGGSFIVNMKTITNTDITSADSNTSLVEHLKSDDFFNVKDYPYANLAITKVEYSDKTQARIEANLTIKDITEQIDFRAEFDPDKNEVHAKFKIDRTIWGISYNNPIKNEAISDAIGLEIKLSY